MSCMYKKVLGVRLQGLYAVKCGVETKVQFALARKVSVRTRTTLLSLHFDLILEELSTCFAEQSRAWSHHLCIPLRLQT